MNAAHPVQGGKQPEESTEGSKMRSVWSVEVKNADLCAHFPSTSQAIGVCTVATGERLVTATRKCRGEAKRTRELRERGKRLVAL